MALMDNLLNAATQVLGGNSENGAQGSMTDMAMDLVKQQGGVGNLINQLQQGGLGDTLSSWVSNQSSNLPVSGSDLQNALGSDTVTKSRKNSAWMSVKQAICWQKYCLTWSIKPHLNGTAQDADGFGLDDIASMLLKKLYEIMS